MAMSVDALKKMCSPDTIALNAAVFDNARPTEARRNKYNARKITVDNMVFDSKGEYRRWVELSNMQRAGLIQNLERQTKFILQESFVGEDGKKVRQISYSADYTYTEDGILVIEDFKSPATRKTDGFRLRWRLLLNKFNNDSNIRCVLTGD